jgi:hypothetical protein
MEALYYVSAFRTGRGWPWTRKGEPGVWACLVAALLRAAVGGALAAATSTSGQISSELGLFLLGAAAPTVMPPLLRVVGSTVTTVVTRLLTPVPPPADSGELGSAEFEQPGGGRDAG